MKTYIDCNVISVYSAVRPRGEVSNAQWVETRMLFDMASARKIRFFSSSFIKEEAKRGHKGAARKRLNALRKVTIVAETAPVRAEAQGLCAQIPGQVLTDSLKGDARHLVAAKTMGAKYLVTWDVDDFKFLQRFHGGDAPEILTPIQAHAVLEAEIYPNPQDRNLYERAQRLTPFLRKIIKQTKRAQAQVCREDGFDVGLKARRKELYGR
jgi:hypothetical protein